MVGGNIKGGRAQAKMKLFGHLARCPGCNRTERVFDCKSWEVTCTRLAQVCLRPLKNNNFVYDDAYCSIRPKISALILTAATEF